MTDAKTGTWLDASLAKKSLSKMVMEKIKDAMIAGELKPGDFLPSETEIIAGLGVGKSSVREAVKMLEALGVVEIIKGQGSRIRTSVDYDVMDPVIFQMILQCGSDKKSFVEFRRLFETSSTLLAMERATPEDFESLRRITRRMEEAFAQGPADADNDVAFHNAVYDATHNPFVIHLGRMVVRLFRPSLEVSNREYPQRVLADHHDILDAMERKDAEAVQSAIAKSLASWDQLAVGKGGTSESRIFRRK